MNFLAFLLRRSKYHWLLLLTLIFGILLASAFLASGPVLIDALLDYGLRRTLINANAREDVFHLALRESSEEDQYWRIDNQLSQFINEHVTHLDLNLIPVGNVGFMYPWKNEQLSPDRKLTLGFYGSDLAELSQRMEFVAGTFPEFRIKKTDEIQVFIGTFLARSMQLNVGDRLPVSFSSKSNQPDLYLRISGIVSPLNHFDPYWLDRFNPFWAVESTDDTILYGVFIPRETFFNLADQLYPSLSVSYFWQGIIHGDQTSFEDLEDLRSTFRNLGNEIASVHSGLLINTTLVDVLNEFSTQATLVRSPLYFLIGIVVLMALYYLVMMSSLYLEQMRSEFAVMRSRGAPGGLLVKLELIEGLGFSAIAILGGPFLAWLFVRWLSDFGPLAALAEHGWGLSIPQAAWLSSLIAASACISSLLLPLPEALKRSITTHHQNLARISRAPWWQRFYLDVFTLALGILLLYRVELYGSILGGSTETPQIDFMLILAPLFLLIGTAAIFLRIFPVFLRKSAGLASRGVGLPIVLALRQAARQPKHVTRLVLLLMLAMALGLFSTSLDATLKQNELDRANYYVGSDLRVIAERSSITFEGQAPASRESALWRSEAALLTSDVSPTINLLAINPDTFTRITQYRRDFAEHPVPTLMDKMLDDWEINWTPLPLTYLPGEPSHIGLWFSLPYGHHNDPNSFEIAAQTTFELLLHPTQGKDLTVILEAQAHDYDPDINWYHFQGNIPELSSESYPLTLVSIWMHHSDLQWETFEPLWIDDISVVDRHTKAETIVESFEYDDPYVWKSQTLQLSSYSLKTNPHTDQSSLGLFFETSAMSPYRWYGMNRVNDTDFQAIPCLVSPLFLEWTEIEPGDSIRLKVKLPERAVWDDVTFKIIDVVDYFPTMYEEEDASFLVTLYDPLLEQLNVYRRSSIQSNELLIESSDPYTTQTYLLNSGLSQNQVLSSERILKELRSHPLTIGLRSVTRFGYYLTTVLSLVGFGTHFYLSTKQRATNYSILRALGLSPGQLYSTMLIEQIILLISGLALGTILGLILNQLTLSGLPLRLGELETIPPFLVQTNWILVLRVYFTLVIAFLLSLGLAIFILWRVQIHRVLRIGEE